MCRWDSRDKKWCIAKMATWVSSHITVQRQNRHWIESPWWYEGSSTSTTRPCVGQNVRSLRSCSLQMTAAHSSTDALLEPRFTTKTTNSRRKKMNLRPDMDSLAVEHGQDIFSRPQATHERYSLVFKPTKTGGVQRSFRIYWDMFFFPRFNQFLLRVFVCFFWMVLCWSQTNAMKNFVRSSWPIQAVKFCAVVASCNLCQRTSV